jgi:hypothetical protein
MEGSRKWVSGVVLSAVIAFAVIAPGLQASPAAALGFKLPFDAQWGEKALPTGDYTFLVDHFSSNGMIFVYRGGQAVGIFHPQIFEGLESQSKRAELVCIRHDGNVTVQALRLPHAGTFYFYLPKELKALVAQDPKLIETVSIEASGN